MCIYDMISGYEKGISRPMCLSFCASRAANVPWFQFRSASRVAKHREDEPRLVVYMVITPVHMGNNPAKSWELTNHGCDHMVSWI